MVLTWDELAVRMKAQLEHMEEPRDIEAPDAPFVEDALDACEDARRCAAGLRGVLDVVKPFISSPVATERERVLAIRVVHAVLNGLVPD